MKGFRLGALSVFALVNLTVSANAEVQSQILAHFYALMDQAAAAKAQRLDVSDQVCGRVSTESLNALSDSGSLEYLQIPEGLEPSATGNSRWTLVRLEKLFWTRRLDIEIHPETGDCAATVWVHGL